MATLCRRHDGEADRVGVRMIGSRRQALEPPALPVVIEAREVDTSTLGCVDAIEAAQGSPDPALERG